MMTQSSGDRLKIAVVGAGISGLSAAWLLSERHDVTLYEQEDRLGGHANTVDVETPSGQTAVDTGFIVYNPTNYPNFTALMQHLCVESEPSNMSFAVSLDGGVFEYGGDTLRNIFAQKSNLVSPRFWSMLRGLLRFYKQAPLDLARLEATGATLGDYLESVGYSKAFQRDHLLPMAGAIWSATPEALRHYPAAAFIRFFVNHGLLKLSDRPQWRTVKGGSRNYVARLASRIAGRIRTGATVRAITRENGKVRVSVEGIEPETFDHAVFATHADTTRSILQDVTRDEHEVLSAFTYTTNFAVLHTDKRLMPKRRQVWSSWNYIGSRYGSENDICVSYWMNRLQRLTTSEDLFITLNPVILPDEKTVLFSKTYKHPFYTREAIAAQKRLPILQGQRSTWYCGAYFGSGFHEDGLTSGIGVAEALGGTMPPWKLHERAHRVVRVTPVSELVS